MSNYSTLYKILSGLIDNVSNLNSKQEAETSLLLSTNIGSAGSNISAVETLSAEFTPTESDLGKVYLWSVDETTNMKKGHIYKVLSREVTTTTESSGGSEGFTISGSTLSGHNSITTIDGVYTPYKTGTVNFSDGTTGTGVIAYANEDKSIFIFQTKFTSGSSMLVWAIYTEVKEYIGGPPVAFAYFNATSNGTTYYTPTISEICNKTWLAAYTSSTDSSTYSLSKGTWTPLSGGTITTTTTSTEYYLEDITVISSSTDDSSLSSQINTNTSNISSLSASIGDINTALANILNE